MGVPTIAQTCPIGDCPVTITWEYGENAREPGFLNEAKKKLRQHLQNGHKDGTHKKLVAEVRNAKD